MPEWWRLLIRVAVFTGLFLVAGCADIRVRTPYTTEAIERLRAECLEDGRTWVENARQFSCWPPKDGT